MPNYSEINNAFLEGMNTLFLTLFTDELYFKFLDEENTQINVYKETLSKAYKNEKKLSGKVVITNEKDELPDRSINISVVITIPTKQLIDNNIPHTSNEDILNLQKGIFIYKGFTYEIERVKSRVQLANEWQFYDFYCFQADSELI